MKNSKHNGGTGKDKLKKGASKADPAGSYTGRPLYGEQPEQDADDL